MTSRSRRLVVPALLVVAACLPTGVALVVYPDEPVLLVALAALVVLALLSGVLLARGSAGSEAELASARRREAEVVGLLEDVFALPTPTLLVTTDTQGLITRFNPGAEALVGVPAAEALGRPPGFFLDDAELASWALAMRTEHDFAQVAARLVASDQPQPIEWPYLRPDGERRVLALAIAAIRDPGGVTTGYLCTGHDVTDQGRGPGGTEQFLATMSLELRAPMASILGYAEMLQEELVDADRAGARSFVERIERNGQRMLLLIQDLLTLTRVEDTDLELQEDRLDLRLLVQAAYDDLVTRVEDRKVDVSLRLPPDPVLQVCDARLLEQAVQHLVSNAAKFTPDGGRIVVSVKGSETQNRIVVGDTGMGISQTDRDQLFVRFFRSHRPEVQQLQGSGLGLAIVAAVVAAHRGAVSVESELGRGSTFVLELPTRSTGETSAPTEALASPSMTS